MRTSLVTHWLRPHASNAGDMTSIPGQRTKIPHAVGQLSPDATATKPAHCNYPEACTLRQRARTPRLRSKAAN